jgi:TIR domain/YARHG domain
VVEGHKVFICHATEDKVVASHICEILEGNKVPCWIAPRDIKPGHDYGEEIIRAIEEARALVLVLSTYSNKSEHVKREVERAVNKGIEVVPFRIEEILPSKSLEYFISTTQWVDAFTKPLEDHIAYLAESLKSLGPPAGAEIQGTRDLSQPAVVPVKPKSRWLRWPILAALLATILVATAGIWGAFYWSTPVPDTLEPPHAQTEWPRWPWTSERLVTDKDLAPLSNYELSLMRNEIYARKGWIFTYDDLKDYFGKQKWYKPAGDPAEKDKINSKITGQLNYFERENANRIRELEETRRR